MTASDAGEIDHIDDKTLTAEDIAGLNRQAVERAAAFSRLAGTALVIAGAVAAVAWAWTVVRAQQTVDDFGNVEPVSVEAPSDALAEEAEVFDPFGGLFDASFADRVDLLVGQIQLALVAVLTVGVGLGLRLIADYSVARTGGSLTGYQVGDQV
jgi:hypothetical protein